MNIFKRLCCSLLVVCILATTFAYADDGVDVGEVIEELPVAEEVILEETDISADEDIMLYEIDGTTVGVSSAEELEAAILQGYENVELLNDFELDRTFVIERDITVYATQPVILTRDVNFGGDIFLIGPEAIPEDTTVPSVTVTFGDENSADNLITIDGNKDNMLVDVSGTAFFMRNNALTNLHGVTVENAKKVANERTLEEVYELSYITRIGGPAVILASGELNIYNCSFLSNEANEETSTDEEGMISTQGGAIYSFGKLNIYNATIDGNSAGRGGAIYNYRETHIYDAVFSNNTATYRGGAIYIPASTLAFLYTGEENGTVLFEGNSASAAGAVYNQGTSVLNNTTFSGNTATSSHGGAVYVTDQITDSKSIEIYNSSFDGNQSYYNGGAIYFGTNATSYLEGLTFTNNEALATANADGNRYGGGAVYGTGANIEINGATFENNTSDNMGGAFEIHSSTVAVLNDITATGNSAPNSSGGFMYVKGADVKLYNSELSGNTASSGGAVELRDGATGGIYNTIFAQNETTGNGGALFIYTDGGKVVLHSNTFNGNVSGNFGGAIYASKASLVDMYNTTATDNNAVSGGFMYQTTTGTTVNLNGITVSGNTAANGPVIFGNTTKAILNINKTNYFDEEATELNDDYWAGAIYNKLTVNSLISSIPGYTDYGQQEPEIPEGPSEVVYGVSNSAELESALSQGYSKIQLLDDFTVDRTFSVKKDTLIYSTNAVTLTRADNFAGDIFLVGPDAVAEDGVTPVTVTFGDEASTDNLITVDGNKANMTVDVTGTVFFLRNGAVTNLHGVTVKNSKKVANERTLDESYNLSYTNRIGGPAVILASGELNIYDCSFLNNEANDETSTEEEGMISTQGGAIYSFGKLNIHNATIEGNKAGRGGAIYNYRETHIYNALIKNNSATYRGGAIYVPASTLAFLYTGENSGEVVFEENTATGGGAIYHQGTAVLSNTTFKGNNSTEEHGGAVWAVGQVGEAKTIELYNTTFEDNQSYYNGGAVYFGAKSVSYMESVAFSGNNALATANADGNRYGGGAIYGTGATFEINGATFTNNTSDNMGGAIEIHSSSVAVLNDVIATGNSAVNSSGGFMYAKGATATIYNSEINNNSASSGGAVEFRDGSSGGIYKTKFTGNSATGNGGALYIYTDGGKVTLHSNTFTGNTSGNYGGVIYVSKASQVDMYNTIARNNSAVSGGFMYETTTGTVVNMNGITVSGNTATNGPIIFGNTTNAKLNINKANYVDEQVTELTDDYWKTAIYNKLTVADLEGEIPKYQDYGNESFDGENVVDVRTIDELEAAVNSQAKSIRIVSNITIDRTLYIINDINIFSTTKRSLKRSPSFAGDMFVVGEDKDGNSAISLGLEAKLTLGNPASTTSDLLVIDGNKANTTVDVVGSAVFLCESATLNIYENTSVINCNKVGNEKALDEKYLLSSAAKAGGAVVLNVSGTINVYGGLIKDNTSLNADNTSNGGAIYNRGSLNIYSATLENNTAVLGGAVYSNRNVKISTAKFIANHSLKSGGAIYMAGSQYAQLYAGNVDNAGVSDNILFKNNTSDENAGAVYCASEAAVVFYGDVTFEGNTTPNGTGAAISAYGSVNVNNGVFKNNVAYSRGGAVYISNADDTLTTRIVTLKNSLFEGNIGKHGGAVAVYSADAQYSGGGIVEIENCSFIGNKAFDQSGSATPDNTYGGAVYNARKASVTISDSNFEGNEASYEGGAIYTAGEGTTSVTNTMFKNNTVTMTDGRGGAVAVHSATLDFDGATFDGNTSPTNGGAVYISYTSASEINSDVNIVNSFFNNNSAAEHGGAIYATEHEVLEDKLVLNVKATEFNDNTAVRGGAVYLTSSVDAYMKNVDFNRNKAQNTTDKAYGGAIYLASTASAEIDTANFIDNSTTYYGGAIAANSSSKVILYNIIADGNDAPSGGAGFYYGNNAKATMYDSIIKNSEVSANGGAVALYNTATVEAYGITFENNYAAGNGGAVYDYTNLTEAMFHSCIFNNNKADGFGGAFYLSNEGVLTLYNNEAAANSAARGGFLYETTTGTLATINGLTVDSNTATEDGNIIYGNSFGATLNIHKINYVDKQSTDTVDDIYWDNAIKNELTVVDISDTEDIIPPKEQYVIKETGDVEEEERIPVPVDDVLSLGLNSSDGFIISTYDKLERLDNSSNFMSDNVTTFENINGETVTVDSFVYHPGQAAGNTNVGEGLLIYQAILYKQAHPEEDVSIDLATFRFETETAVCINRNSRYFGYMRNLVGADYDKFGFVRISYLLVTAAKMGINVTIIGQLPGYPHNPTDPTFDEYFTYYLKEPCDPAYVENGKVGDFMNFAHCQWTSYDNKAATDMMHLKMCAVSDYLDMNGVAHKNAVWSASSNLDGINGNGTNGNNSLQTATIVSDHEEIYRTTTNYIRFVSEYCGQEDVYLFRSAANQRATEQIDLILSGRGNEIPKDKQIVYLGSENDDVFELYFAPFAGEPSVWSESYNPFCKYIAKLKNSEDYIILTWNNANYNSAALVAQMESMISDAFHENKDPRNKLYINLSEFDTSVYNDLVVGEDIGLMSFNKREFGIIHSKDMQVSYVENGVRHYVTLMNSMNIHTGSMSYQSNFMLVINEKDEDEDSVFFTLADNTTTGVVEHTYGEEKSFIPGTTEDGYTYKECTICGKIQKLSPIHRPSDWIVATEPTVNTIGVLYKKCIGCDMLLEAKEETGENKDFTEQVGKKFTGDVSSLVPIEQAETPYTFEATVSVPESVTGRAGVIAGNYKLAKRNVISFEIASGGKVRLYYVTDGVIGDVVFGQDIRSDKPTHIAVTVNGSEATLYVDGEKSETKAMSLPLPSSFDNAKIGGDNRLGNVQYFKGTIYNVALFADARTDSEIKSDSIIISDDSDNLITYKYLEQVKEEIADEEYQMVTVEGEKFTATNKYPLPAFTTTPHTFEATLLVPTSYASRAGAVISNYSTTSATNICFEIYTNGRPRLVYKTPTRSVDCIFSTDVRSEKSKHIAITVEGLTAKLYVDGELAEQKTVATEIAESLSDYKIGGDNRSGNSQFFKGTLYSVALFSDARTADEIKKDSIFVSKNEEQLLYSGYYVKDTDTPGFAEISGRSFTQKDLKDMPALESAPLTFDAVINVPKSVSGRAGVIVGNYKYGATKVINLEITDGGRVRLYSSTDGEFEEIIFTDDIRSDKPERITVTVDGLDVSLYVNGEFREVKALNNPLSQATTEFKIGGDDRTDNLQYFKGSIYYVSLFSDVRSADEIAKNTLSGDENILYSTHFITTPKGLIDYESEGRTFTSKVDSAIATGINKVPLTYEAIIQVDKDMEARAGVIVGNYKEAVRDDIVSLEIYNKGKPRLYYVNNGRIESVVFNTDIRSGKPKHIAVKIDEARAVLYINGVKTEEKILNCSLPSNVSDFKIGGDNRVGNRQYFKGKIYNVSLFEDVRTDQEITNDVISVGNSEQGLLYNIDFSKGICKESITGGTHQESDWITDKLPSADEKGMRHKECILCGTVLVVNEYSSENFNANYINYNSDDIGITVASPEDIFKIEESLSSSPLTFEVMFKLPKNINARGGALLGNYGSSSKEQINIEVYNNGKARLYYKANNVGYTHLFATDVRSDNIAHLAVTIDGLTAKLYFNGDLKETVTLTGAFPTTSVSSYTVGADNRTNNPIYFLGTIYGVNMFSDVRTDEEIKTDAILVPSDADGLIYSHYFK